MAWAYSRRQRAERVPVMPGALHLAGLPCQVRGFVVCGDGRGRMLGYPTANIALAGHPELPPDGVFAGEYRRPDGSRYDAMISLGRRPTFYLAAGARLLEAHLLDFSEPLYGEAAVLDFRHWIRDQRQFGSPEALARQIKRDASAVREALAVSS
jgi:FAD synthase